MSTYHSNRHEPSTALVRMDRMARPQWNALPPAVTQALEERIPDGCHLSIVSAFFSGFDYHARLFRDGRELVAESRLCRYVEDAAEEALSRYERGTVEVREGYVVEPLENVGDLNREGDPAFNGAFDRW